jgi:hypothetical protein
VKPPEDFDEPSSGNAHLPSHQSQIATALGFTIPQFLL